MKKYLEHPSYKIIRRYESECKGNGQVLVAGFHQFRFPSKSCHGFFLVKSSSFLLIEEIIIIRSQQNITYVLLPCRASQLSQAIESLVLIFKMKFNNTTSKSIFLVIFLIHTCLTISELPQGWTQHVWNGRPYFFNQATGQSSWTLPEASVNSQHDSPATATGTSTVAASRPCTFSSRVHSRFSRSRSSQAIATDKSNTARKDQNAVNTATQDAEFQLQSLLREKNVLQEQIDQINLERESLRQNLTSVMEESKSFSLSLERINKELDEERRERKSLEKEKEELASRFEELQGNSTAELESIKGELAIKYEEIEKLEKDLRSVAGGSIKRLRQHSFLWRLFSPIIGFVRMGGGGTVRNGVFNSMDSMEKYVDIDEDETGNHNNDDDVDTENDKAIGRSKSRRSKEKSSMVDGRQLSLEGHQLERIEAMNRTINRLRENLTAMSHALESKEDLICELSEQLEENEEEAEKRRKAYAALRDGISTLQEENSDLIEAVEVRDEWLLEASLNRDLQALEEYIPIQAHLSCVAHLTNELEQLKDKYMRTDNINVNQSGHVEEKEEDEGSRLEEEQKEQEE